MLQEFHDRVHRSEQWGAMLRTLIVGLGRAGAGLHLPVLDRLRSNKDNGNLFADHPIVVCDPARPGTQGYRSAVSSGSIADCPRLTDPNHTVVHLCTPPADRVGVIAELARLGFRRIIVEKPLVNRIDEFDTIVDLKAKYGLDIVVVAHWLCAELTHRLVDITNKGGLGALRGITVSQHKSRFSRSMATSGHITAFDVEIPHAIGVVLRLAGPAQLVSAECTAMCCDDWNLPDLGGARLTLRHAGGVRSRLHSDLTSPVRERRLTLRFEWGVVSGHYPVSADDDFARMRVLVGGRREDRVFRDNALEAFLLDSYRYFTGNGPAPDAGFDFQTGAAWLLLTAKAVSGAVRPRDELVRDRVG
jgi:hypothetical protein